MSFPINNLWILLLFMVTFKNVLSLLLRTGTLLAAFASYPNVCDTLHSLNSDSAALMFFKRRTM